MEKTVSINNKTFWFYLLAAAFIGATILGFAFNFYYTALLPVLLVVGYLMLFSYDKAIYLIAFLVPVSVTVQDIGFGAGLNVPTEPLIIFLFLLSIQQLLLKNEVSREFWRHPITIAVLINTAWLLITAFSSTMPLVSFKYWIARVWYILVFFVMGSLVFKDRKSMLTFLGSIIISLCIIVTIISIRHSFSGFSRDTVTHVIYPFYWIHGVYSAILALFAPVLLILGIFGKQLNITPLRRVFLVVFAIVLILAIRHTYARAAWVSLFIAGGAWLLFTLRVRLWTIGSVILILGVLFLVYQDDILIELSQNKQGSTGKSMEKHLQSATNIQNDPSNLERLNRWSCAWRMFKDKPVFGFGPGTYMFQYAPYQLSHEKTVISTNFSTLGHAHSEYLGPLAESGIIGMLSWLAVFVITLVRGVHLFYKAHLPYIRFLSLALTLGLITYYTHGFLNSYFDFDKIAVPFWAFTCMIVVMDIQNKKSNLESNIST